MPGPATAPVFVVGAPRSGTTMLVAMLAAHSRFAGGPETQFFSKLPEDALAKAAAAPDWPASAVSLLEGLTLAGQPVIALFETDPARLAADLEARTPSVRAMLEALTEPFAAKRGKARWVEKTPNHILHVETLRRLWPEARIVRIVRDPRDVGMSTCKLPAFSDRILPNVYLWQRWHAHARGFFERDPLAFSLRYEDLVDDPEVELGQLCAFLGEAFEPAMLDFQRHANAVSTAAESWKTGVSKGLTKDRKQAWRDRLPEQLRPVSDMVCAELLDAFGYEREHEAHETRTAYRMSRAYIERQEAALIHDAARGVRWLSSDDPRRVDRVVDQPRYRRFRDPASVARLGIGQLAAAADRLRAPGA